MEKVDARLCEGNLNSDGTGSNLPIITTITEFGVTGWTELSIGTYQHVVHSALQSSSAGCATRRDLKDITLVCMTAFDGLDNLLRRNE